MRIPDHPTCLLRNLYAAQEATVRTEHNQQQTDSNVFFLMAEYYSIVYMYHSFLIHSSADSQDMEAT